MCAGRASADEDMSSRKDQALDILSEIRSTPASERRRRIEKLEKPMLVHLAGLAFLEWDRERGLLQAEIEKRDYHISRIEAILLERKRKEE